MERHDERPRVLSAGELGQHRALGDVLLQLERLEHQRRVERVDQQALSSHRAPRLACRVGTGGRPAVVNRGLNVVTRA